MTRLLTKHTQSEKVFAKKLEGKAIPEIQSGKNKAIFLCVAWTRQAAVVAFFLLFTVRQIYGNVLRPDCTFFDCRHRYAHTQWKAGELKLICCQKAVGGNMGGVE